MARCRPASLFSLAGAGGAQEARSLAAPEIERCGGRLNVLADGSMEYHLGITLLRIFVGFLLAAVAGIGLGVLMGMSRIVARIADAWIAALYPLPKISLIPLLIIWLGTGEAYKIVISAVTAAA